MTYVSRRTRIIVSRWLDECDAEYRLQASRKRSEGRLKRYSSCDDFRAWINDNCIKHEYLTDLMSSGEFSGPPYRLFGRFIPVPVLFQLAQGSSATDTKQSEEKQYADVNVDARRSWSATGVKQSDVNTGLQQDEKETVADNAQDVAEVRSNSSLLRAQWEKNVLERSLFECTCLLNRAMTKLEKIDSIVALANEETERVRTEEIRNAFSKYRVTSSSPSCSPASRLCSKKLKESAKCTELLRRISGLREKLKKIQECRVEVNHQIESSKRRFECVSSLQVTELYSRREQANIKKLQKKLEKLITERGRLLSEMCHALTSLNNIKRSSKSTVNCLRGNSKQFGTGIDYVNERSRDSTRCSCDCRWSENTGESEDSYLESQAKLPCSDSSSSDSDNSGYAKSRQRERSFSFDLYGPNDKEDNEDADCRNYLKSHDYEKSLDKNSDLLDSKEYADSITQKQYQQVETKDGKVDIGKKGKVDIGKDGKVDIGKDGKVDIGKDGKVDIGKDRKAENGKSEQAESTKETKCRRKSKVKFICQVPPCRKKLDADDLSAFESSLTQEQLCVISEALQNIQSSRSSTSPTTKKERQSKSLDRNPLMGNRSQGNTLDRRVKSETTMKEIEKSLRNYQRRLSDLEGIDLKVEEMREKMSESHTLRKNLAKMKAEAKRQRDADREKSEREISRLFVENWELKKQMQDLTAKFSAQSKKMENLKCGAMRARELECEAEELKKKLSEYRDGFEHQRKCISKWESVVAVQRTEIENLMNHIRMLTTVKEEEASRSIQRSRSYSPEMIRGRRLSTRARPQRCIQVSDEESCCYGSYLQRDSRQMHPLSGFDGGYYPTETEWCN